MTINKLYGLIMAVFMVPSISGSVYVASSFGPARVGYSFHVPVVRHAVALAVGAGVVAGAIYHWYSWYPNTSKKWNKRYEWAQEVYLSLPLFDKQLDNTNEYELLKGFYAGSEYPLIDAVNSLETGLIEVRYLLKHAAKLSASDQGVIMYAVFALQVYEQNALHNLVYLKMKPEYSMQKSTLAQARIACEIALAGLRHY